MLSSLPQSLPSPRPSRWRAVLALGAAVLTLHAALLSRTPATPPGRNASAGAPPLQVRHIVLPALKPGAAPAAPGAAAAAPTTSAAARRRPAPAPKKTAAAGMDAAPEVVEAPAPGGGTPPPTYATRLPAAATLQYTVLQGSTVGRVELRWRPEGGRYRLTLEREGPGQPAQGAASQGALGHTGLAPERYVESRRGREQRAVNFQHEAGRITFSGPQTEFALLPGAQDRLSWMLQLPAVLEAESGLREPGSELRVFVAGAGGDGQVWTFTVRGRESLQTPAGPVAGALHLQRAPLRPYDAQVDVWLDPTRQHLPARLRLQFPPAPAGTEWVLEQHATP